MQPLIILIIALGLAMDCFSVAIANAHHPERLSPGSALKTALAFSMGHFVLFYAGYYLGNLIHPLFQGMEYWAAAVVFAIMGLKIYKASRRQTAQARIFDLDSPRVIFILSLATSMDALLGGMAVSLLGGRAMNAALIIAALVFTFTLSGLAGGKSLGLSFARQSRLFGGIFFWLIAAWMVWQYLVQTGIF